MKNFCQLLLLFLCAIFLVPPSCALEKEPDIPTGFNNIIEPVFLNAEVASDTDDNFQVKAWLDSLGNLNIKYHGWVWSKTPKPDLQDDNLLLGPLAVDSFSNIITGLDLGEIYYLRPVVITGNDTIYGLELCSFLGVNFTINTDTEIFQGADVQFTNTTILGNCTYLWEFGDGDTSTKASPKHTFDKNMGNVTVRLTADNSGCKATKTIILEIIPDPFKDYWVSIPGGTFMMGCTQEQELDCNPNENPPHQVTLDSYLIGKTEITQGQWLAVMGNNPSLWDDGDLDYPVEFVSWNSIVNEFIPTLNKKTGRTHRLPTEAEWEFAARGGNNSMGYKYAGGNDVNDVAWHGSISNPQSPRPVGKKTGNELGLYDMSGNVFEWCQDWYGSYSDSSQTNPTGPVMGDKRVNRGGSWYGDTLDCRVAFRHNISPGIRLSNLGFRLARSY